MKAALFILLIIFPDLLGTQRFADKRSQSPAVISCGPADFSDGDTTLNGKFVTILPGWGAHSFLISTRNDSARFYFNQGINMYYSYHMREASASFREAARFDSASAMAYWGDALAMGPIYNLNHLYKMKGRVLTVLANMNRHSSEASAKERRLITVMNMRYSADSFDLERKALNKAYGDGMMQLTKEFPGDDEIKVLAIDAVMLQHPWDFWNNDGSPKEWTPALVKLCEEVLRNNPRHPAAIHYYIHITEASRHPEVALPYADVLKQLLPGVAHMVHMASHEYERNGLFAEGATVNDSADNALIRYYALAKHLGVGEHSTHYFAVQSWCAMSGGMYKKAMHDAIRCRATVEPDNGNTYAQYAFMLPAMANVRLGRWEEILNDSVVPESNWSFARALYHFCRGLAYVHDDRTDLAMKELDGLRKEARDTVLAVINIPFNAPLASVNIAKHVLNGSILFNEARHAPSLRGRKGKADSALAEFRRAVRIDDSLVYSEPKDWLIPTRQFLGAYLLELKQFAQAEKVYREDLVWNPGNGWSLLGLHQSLERQGRRAELEAIQKQYERSFSQADEIPPGSVYY